MEGDRDVLMYRAVGLAHQMKRLEDELTDLLSFMTEEEQYEFIDSVYTALEGINHE